MSSRKGMLQEIFTGNKLKSSVQLILFQTTLNPNLIKTAAVDNVFEIIQNNMSSLVNDIICVF